MFLDNIYMSCSIEYFYFFIYLKLPGRQTGGYKLKKVYSIYHYKPNKTTKFASKLPASTTRTGHF